MADHALWAIGVVTALLRLGIIPAADAPAFLAGRVITAVAVVSTTPIDLSALVLNAALAIITLGILTAASRLIAPLAKAGFWVAHHILGTGIVTTTSDRLIFHRNTDSIVLIDALAFGPFRAITVGLARDNAEPALRGINAD